MIRKGTPANGCDVSADGEYRYLLWRRWAPGDSMVWVMLNPSMADHERDDQTVTKCIGFARRLGYSGIEVINLYALRTTDPMVLRDYDDPEGPGNRSTWDATLRYFHRGPVVAAWGGSFPRSLEPSNALRHADTTSWLCLGHTVEGHPRHPARIAYATELRPYERTT